MAAAQLPGNGRFRGSEDDKFEFWAMFTRLGDLLASSGQVEEQTREHLGEAIKRNRELLDIKRIPLLTRKRWLRQLRREVEHIEGSGLDNAKAQSLYEMLGRIQEKAEKYRDE
jgi:hypothetical protein